MVHFLANILQKFGRQDMLSFAGSHCYLAALPAASDSRAIHGIMSPCGAGYGVGARGINLLLRSHSNRLNECLNSQLIGSPSSRVLRAISAKCITCDAQAVLDKQASCLRPLVEI